MKQKFFTGSLSPDITEKEIEHRAICRRIASEGMVLLKNDGIFPIKSGSRIALFGGGALYTVKGGTGSGSVNNRSNVSIYEGLDNAGYEIISESWLADYRSRYEKARIEWMDSIYKMAGEPLTFDSLYRAYSANPMPLPRGMDILPDDYSEDDQKNAAAIYVISRISGEGADRKAQKGDYYLSEAEAEELSAITRIFQKTAVILNVGGIIDLAFMDELSVGGLLLMSLAGMEGGNSLADVVSGKVNPCGRLTDTWAGNYLDYYASSTFSHNNGNIIEEKYTEGIYVGYRYFDSFSVEPRYPFGFGLSYTEFDICPGKCRIEGHEVLLSVRITNTGSCAGRQVLQAYVSCPQGLRRKELKRLAAFKKTHLLSPGDSEDMVLSFDLDLLSSYHAGKSRYFFDKGDYYLLLGTDALHVCAAGVLELNETRWQKKLLPICPLLDSLKEIEPQEEFLRAKRKVWAKEASDKALPVLDIMPAVELLISRQTTTPGSVSSIWRQNPEAVSGCEPSAVQQRQDGALARTSAVLQRAETSQKEYLSRILKNLTLEEKAALVCGRPRGETAEFIGNAAVHVPGAAGETCCILEEKGILPATLADGPAGIRITQCYEENPEDGSLYVQTPVEMLENRFFGKTFEHEGSIRHYQFCSAIPVGTLLAQSFDTDLVEEAARLIADEMREFHITLWLAPGMNIHRNPLCGRNFEYFSEDPLISARMACAITRGVQNDPQLGVTIKHFACNNQEENRRGVSSIVSERALREIYLKGFEIAVRESRPMAIMTSYNKINGVHTANSYDLCTIAAREEWGFDGIIMTDWTTTNSDGGSSAAKCIAAGNDLIMPGMRSDIQEIIDAVRELNDQSLPEEALDACAGRILAMLSKAGLIKE